MSGARCVRGGASLAVLALLALFALLAPGCATLPEEGGAAAAIVVPPPPPPPVATLLLPVTFVNLVRAGVVPALLELELRSEAGETVVFSQRASLPLAGDSAGNVDYLFRLTLPPGRYRVTQVAGLARVESGNARFAAPIDLPLDADGAGHRYIGRLVVQNVLPARPFVDVPAARDERPPLARMQALAQAAPTAAAKGLNGGVLQFNTAWSVDDDLAQYRDALAGVAREAIALRPFSTLATPGRTGPGESDVARSFEELDVAQVATTLAPPRLAEANGADLLADKPPLRTAFRQYQAAAAPKAFAVSGDGNWAAASGADAVTRALTECARKSKRCRLFAIDDRLVLERTR